MNKVVHEEEENRSYRGNDGKSDAEFAKLQADAMRATTKAIDASRASGHAYKMNGQNYGEQETSNFSILLATYCAEMNIDVRTGQPTTTLRNR